MYKDMSLTAGQKLALLRTLTNHLSCWAMQHMAMAYLEIEEMPTNFQAGYLLGLT